MEVDDWRKASSKGFLTYSHSFPVRAFANERLHTLLPIKILLLYKSDDTTDPSAVASICRASFRSSARLDQFPRLCTNEDNVLMSATKLEVPSEKRLETTTFASKKSSFPKPDSNQYIEVWGHTLVNYNAVKRM